MITSETVSTLIKKARKIRGLSQEEFGEEINKPQSLVSKYERGKVIPPGDIIMHCMTIVEGKMPSDEVSSTDVARLIEKHLASPNFAKLRSALAELIASLSTSSLQLPTRKNNVRFKDSSG